VEEKTMEELLSEYDDRMEDLEEGSVIEGRIHAIGDEEAVIDLGNVFDGIAKINEISYDEREVGKSLSFMILKIDDQAGQVVLSRKEARALETVEAVKGAKRESATLEVTVEEVIKGGLRVDYQGMRGFIPFSQIDTKPVDHAEELVGSVILASVMEFSEADQNLVLSSRAPKEKLQQAREEEFYQQLQLDQIMKGRVHKIFKSGALIDLGDAMGYLHINDAAWTRIKDLEAVVREGDLIKVQIKSFDYNEKKISLSLKDLTQDPWDRVHEDFGEGQVTPGRILKDLGGGYLVELPTGVVGFLHHSEAPGRLKEGDAVNVAVETIDTEERKIRLRYRDPKEIVEDYEAEAREETTLGDLFGDLFDRIDKGE